MKKTKYPNEETRRFMEGMHRRQREWRKWTALQAPIISRFLEEAVRFAERKRFEKAKKAAWNAMMAINELDDVWRNMSADGNKFIKTVPKGWENFRKNREESKL